MKKNNIISIPVSNVSNKGNYFKQKQWENLLLWCSACIEQRSVDSDLLQEIESLELVERADIYHVSLYLLKIVDFYKERWATNGNQNIPEMGNSEKSDSQVDLEPFSGVRQVLDRYRDEFDSNGGFGSFFSFEFVAESSDWKVSSDKNSRYSKSPLKTIDVYIGSHFHGAKNPLSIKSEDNNAGDVPAAQVFYYEVVKYISARLMTKESVTLWGGCTARHISLISSLWALLNLGGRNKFDNIKTLSELALASWSLLAIEAHESDVTSKEHIINNIIRFIIVTSRELALVSKHVGITKISNELTAGGGLFEENMFIPMVISYIERLSDNPVENRIYIEAAVSLPDILLGDYGYDIAWYLSDNDWLRFNKAIEKLNNYSVVEEGKPFFLPIDYYWAWVHHKTPEDMIKEVFNFELQLASICFDSYGCDLHMDTDTKNHSWYFNNKFYAKFAQTALERCDFDIAESIILIMLYRSLSEGVALEPWKETANAIVNVINDSNEEFSKFVWNLLDTYEKLYPANTNTLLRMRLCQIKDKCRVSMRGDRSLKLISQIHPHRVEDMINEGENNKLEFKSSLRWSYKEGKINKKLEEVILKSIAAFNNGDGGTLLIGVDDGGVSLGLEKDYSSLGGAKDEFELHLRNLVNKEFGVSFATRNLRITFPVVAENEICRIDIKRGTRPLYLKVTDKNGVKSEKFYVRSGNSSQEVPLSELHAYIADRF